MAWCTDTDQKTSRQTKQMHVLSLQTTPTKKTIRQGTSKKPKAKIKNTNMRSKPSLCKTKTQTPWPDAQTQTKKQAAKQNKCTFCHSKKHYKQKGKRNGTTLKPKKTKRTQTCAQNLIRVKKQNAKRYGLKRGHRPEDKPPQKNTHVFTPQKTSQLKRKRPWHDAETQTKNKNTNMRSKPSPC